MIRDQDILTLRLHRNDRQETLWNSKASVSGCFFDLCQVFQWKPGLATGPAMPWWVDPAARRPRPHARRLLDPAG